MSARAFENYQSNLWPVVGALARRGFAVAPDEARDLMHDFYLDEWERLGTLYDPDRGPFERYMLGAFFQFARRRIARDYSRRKRVRELALTLAAADATAPSVDQIVDEDSRTQLMRRALSTLPTLQREALNHFLGNPAANERDVARQMRMTRYRLRETLVEAVGRLATELDALDRDDELEHQVAVALWRDGRTAAETATFLDQPIADVRRIRKRIVEHLLTALQTSARKTSRSENMFRADTHGTDPDGADVPGSDNTESRISGVSITGGRPTRGNAPLSFLQRVLLSRDPELLRQLRKRAAEVTAALDAVAGTPFTENENRAIAADPWWLAQVYEVLGGEDDTQSREAQIEAAIDDLLSNQEREIAGAFLGLVSSIPQEDMRKWRAQFSLLPQVSHSVLQGLQQHWRDASASDDVAMWLRHGITPATFFEATIGLQLLLERCIEDSHAGSKTVVLLEFGHRAVDHTIDPNSVSVPRQQLLAQIRSSADCPAGAEESVLTWTCLAATRHPLIFQGFKVLAASGPVLAVVSAPDNVATDLMHRWMYEPPNEDDRLENPKVANLRWG